MVDCETPNPRHCGGHERKKKRERWIKERKKPEEGQKEHGGID